MRNLITVFCSLLLILASSSAHCRNVVYPLGNTDLSIVADHISWQINSEYELINGKSLRHQYKTSFQFGLTTKTNKCNKNSDLALNYIKTYATSKRTVFSNIETILINPENDEVLLKGNFFNKTTDGVFYLHISLYSSPKQRFMFVMFDFVNDIDEKTESIFNEVMGLVTPLYSTRGFLDGEDLNEELFEEPLIE